MVDADGTSSSSVCSSSSSSSSAVAYRMFRSLVESADRKFARVRDLPAHGRELHPHCRQKVFKAYTRLWRFQQEHRRELVDAGMRRWEIGEVASRIGQLYYGQYLRTSEVRFLLESYVFYEAILGRGYFETGKQGKGAAARGPPGAARKQQQLSDLGVRCKELRFYARFALVALLLNRRQVVGTLVERFRALLHDSRVTFPGTDFKEWRQVLQEIVQFLNADTACVNSRPLRYSLLFDSHPSSSKFISRFQAQRVLRLQETLLASYHWNEVKFTELTLDTFRMMQCLEWEPSGSFYPMHATESTENGAFSNQSGASGLIDINLTADLTDPSLPPNPRKSILFRPSVSHLLAVIAAICDDLSLDNVLLIYFSASGKSDQSFAFQKDNLGASRNSTNVDTIFQNPHKRDKSLSRDPFINTHPDELCETGLWFGSKGLNYLYPLDLVPFKRRPLFLIIDSDNSHTFKALYETERREMHVLLLSPERSTLQSRSSTDVASNGSMFTFFLASPLQAFCQFVGLTNVDPEIYKNAENILLAAMAQWEVILFTSDNLSPVYVQVLPDPFLRRLILRFIFCRSILSFFHFPGNGSEYLPDCLPDLPGCLSPNSSPVQSGILQVADSLGVASHFHFSDVTEGSLNRKHL